MISRQDFLRRLGAALASLVLAGCLKKGGAGPTATPEIPTVTCYEPVMPEPTPTPTPAATCYTVVPLPTPAAELTRQAEALKATAEAGGLPLDATRQALAALARERLRACWLSLDMLAEQAANETEAAQQRRSALVDEHRLALDDLVSVAELDAVVADMVQVAFVEASFHVWRASAPITCYIALPPAYEPSVDLVGQTAALSEAGDLDPETLDLARAAIARDIVLLALLGTEGVDAQQQVALWQAGQIPVDEQTLQAARFLVELLEE